jgi:hypothetical protein
VVPARSSCHGSLLIRRAQRARRQAETPLSVLCRFPRPALCLRSRCSKPGLSPGLQHPLRIEPSTTQSPLHAEEHCAVTILRKVDDQIGLDFETQWIATFAGSHSVRDQSRGD